MHNRNMPTQKKILYYWMEIINDLPNNIKTCWACGFDFGTQRCHIKARCNGGNDSVDNLVLLCSECHKMQELHCSTINGENDFREKIKNGSPYMAHQFSVQISKAKTLGLING